MSFDILKPGKNGAISLTAKWLRENLNVQTGDMVVQKNEKINGKDTVVLMRFNPSEYLGQQCQNQNADQKVFESNNNDKEKVSTDEGSYPQEDNSVE